MVWAELDLFKRHLICIQWSLFHALPSRCSEVNRRKMLQLNIDLWSHSHPEYNGHGACCRHPSCGMLRFGDTLNCEQDDRSVTRFTCDGSRSKRFSRFFVADHTNEGTYYYDFSWKYGAIKRCNKWITLNNRHNEMVSSP